MGFQKYGSEEPIEEVLKEQQKILEKYVVPEKELERRERELEEEEQDQ